MGVIRYAIAAMLVWGGVQISNAQDYASTDPDCPPTSIESSSENISDEPTVQYEEYSETEFQDPMGTTTVSETAVESDAGAYMDGDCPNDAEANSDVVIEETTNNVVVVEQEKEHSTFGKIWRSPFKFIGNIPKATVSIVSETAEGVGHIVGAPFKGVGKLFGAEEHDNKDMAKAEEKYNKDLMKADEKYQENLDKADNKDPNNSYEYQYEEYGNM